MLARHLPKSVTRVAATLAVGATLAAGAALAQVDGLTIVAPAGPGGGWDQTARALQQALQENDLANNVQVTNIPGAGGTIGLAQFVSNERGEPDALLISGLVMVGAIQTNKSPVTLEQITPIARLTGEYEVIVVPADSEIQTFDQLVEQFKADPASVSWAGGSAGGTDHILVGLIAKELGVDPTKINYVPFSGGGEALAALLGGHVTAGVSGLGEFAGQIAAGELRPIAVSSPERLPEWDIPTLMEQGVNVDLVNWRGIVAPPELTPEERAQLIELVGQAVQTPTWQQILEDRGWMDTYLPGDEFETFLERDRERIEGVLKDIGLI